MSFLDGLHSFESIKEQLQKLLRYTPELATTNEHAHAFYCLFTRIDDWQSVPPETMEELLDEVHKLPADVKARLRAIMDERLASAFAPIKGIGIRMSEQAQRERIPLSARVTKGLMKRLDAEAAIN